MTIGNEKARQDLVAPFSLSDKCNDCVASLAAQDIPLSCPAARLSSAAEDTNSAFAAVTSHDQAGELVANLFVAEAVKGGVLKDGESADTRQTLEQMREGTANCIGAVIIRRDDPRLRPFAQSAGFSEDGSVKPPASKLYVFSRNPVARADTSMLQGEFVLRTGGAEDDSVQVDVYKGSAVAAWTLANTVERIPQDAASATAIIREYFKT